MNSLIRHPHSEQIVTFLQLKQQWENAIAVYNGADPLDHWFNYLYWYEGNIDRDPEQKFTETLERCLTLFEHNECYKQDMRMVKLWLKYIDLQSTPLNFYQILYQRGIGKQSAYFYIGWAHYYDSVNAFKEAESVYNLGFQAKAEPQAELLQAHTNFRMSVSQRMLYNDNSSKKQTVNQLNEQRHQITTLAQANKRLETAQHTQSSQTVQYTELQNSTNAMASTLNYTYSEPQYHQVVETVTTETALTLSNVKLPANFARYCRNNYEIWKPALFLEEPYDPNRRCVYQKNEVYPGDGEEYSPEEIRARKLIVVPQQQQQPQQQQLQTETQPVLQQPVAVANVPPQQTQQNLEDQIEVSTNRFVTQTANGTPKIQTLKIKFKKEKPQGHDISNGLHYTIAHSDTPSSTQIFDQQQLKSNNGFHPYSCQTSTPKVKKHKKLKIVNNYSDPKYMKVSNSNSNSSDYVVQTHVQPQTEYDDANLLLSFAQNDAKQPSTPSKPAQHQQQHQLQHTAYREPKLHNDTMNSTLYQTRNDSLNYNDNANFSFNESHFDNSNCSVASAVGRMNFREEYSTYAENSFFASENNNELRQKRLDKALSIIDTHMAKQTIDPFSTELCKAFLTKLDFPSYEAKDNMYKIVNTPLPKLSNTKVINMADIRYNIEKEVGRGSYGSVYKALDANTGVIVALKYQKPPNIWELYICNEVRKRITSPMVIPGMMDISTAIIAPNASILATEFSQYGSLLDINNKIRQATQKVMHESLVMHLGSQILSIVHHLHANKIIHADIKPDNFLLMRVPNTDMHFPSLRLIDFGCAIDMTLFPEATQFRKVIQTDGFTCVEMQEGRPWSYQTDLFCVAGTVHVMLFGEYMQIQKKFESWDIKQKLPRYLKKHVWSEFFPQLLNIKDVDHLPNLMDMKAKFDQEAMNMDSELQKHIRTLSNLLHRR